MKIKQLHPHEIYKTFHLSGALRYYLLGVLYLCIGVLYFLMIYTVFDHSSDSGKSTKETSVKTSNDNSHNNSYDNSPVKKEWIYFCLGFCYLLGMLIYMYIGYTHKNIVHGKLV